MKNAAFAALSLLAFSACQSNPRIDLPTVERESAQKDVGFMHTTLKQNMDQFGTFDPAAPTNTRLEVDDDIARNLDFQRTMGANVFTTFFEAPENTRYDLSNPGVVTTNCPPGTLNPAATVNISGFIPSTPGIDRLFHYCHLRRTIALAAPGTKVIPFLDRIELPFSLNRGRSLFEQCQRTMRPNLSGRWEKKCILLSLTKTAKELSQLSFALHMEETPLLPLRLAKLSAWTIDDFVGTFCTSLRDSANENFCLTPADVLSIVQAGRCEVAVAGTSDARCNPHFMFLPVVYLSTTPDYFIESFSLGPISTGVGENSRITLSRNDFSELSFQVPNLKDSLRDDTSLRFRVSDNAANGAQCIFNLEDIARFTASPIAKIDGVSGDGAWTNCVRGHLAFQDIELSVFLRHGLTTRPLGDRLRPEYRLNTVLGRLLATTPKRNISLLGHWGSETISIPSFGRQARDLCTGIGTCELVFRMQLNRNRPFVSSETRWKFNIWNVQLWNANEQLNMGMPTSTSGRIGIGAATAPADSIDSILSNGYALKAVANNHRRYGEVLDGAIFFQSAIDEAAYAIQERSEEKMRESWQEIISTFGRRNSKTLYMGLYGDMSIATGYDRSYLNRNLRFNQNEPEIQGALIHDFVPDVSTPDRGIFSGASPAANLSLGLAYLRYPHAKKSALADWTQTLTLQPPTSGSEQYVVAWGGLRASELRFQGAIAPTQNPPISCFELNAGDPPAVIEFQNQEFGFANRAAVIQKTDTTGNCGSRTAQYTPLAASYSSQLAPPVRLRLTENFCAVRNRFAEMRNVRPGAFAICP